MRAPFSFGWVHLSREHLQGVQVHGFDQAFHIGVLDWVPEAGLARLQCRRGPRRRGDRRVVASAYSAHHSMTARCRTRRPTRRPSRPLTPDGVRDPAPGARRSVSERSPMMRRRGGGSSLTAIAVAWIFSSSASWGRCEDIDDDGFEARRPVRVADASEVVDGPERTRRLRCDLEHDDGPASWSCSRTGLASRVSRRRRGPAPCGHRPSCSDTAASAPAGEVPDPLAWLVRGPCITEIEERRTGRSGAPPISPGWPVC